jgi:phosphoribosylformylglycinamidine cyclo-ligase
LLGPHLVTPGDAIVALASSGLHSNGYSLVRRVIDHAGWSLDRHVDDFGRTLGEELLEPTRLYTRPILDLLGHPELDIHALSHVTGGGLAANLARVLSKGTLATVDRSTWQPPAVFPTIQRLGHVPRDDLERTLNLGVGFLAVLPADDADRAVELIRHNGIPAWVIGDISPDDHTTPGTERVSGAKGVDGGAVQVLGEHPEP